MLFRKSQPRIKRLKGPLQLPLKPAAKAKPKPTAPAEIVFRLYRHGERLVCTRLPYANFPYEDLALIPELVEQEVQKLIAKGPLEEA